MFALEARIEALPLPNKFILGVVRDKPSINLSNLNDIPAFHNNLKL